MLSFATVDFDSNGVLEFQEFIKILQVEKLICRFIFLFLISGNEIFRTRTNKAAALDSDQDGNINFEETFRIKSRNRNTFWSIL